MLQISRRSILVGSEGELRWRSGLLLPKARLSPSSSGWLKAIGKGQTQHTEMLIGGFSAAEFVSKGVPVSGAHGMLDSAHLGASGAAAGVSGFAAPAAP
jgi:hypothetical protein